MRAELQAFGQPNTNNLQLLFFDVTNVTLRDAPAITGWLSVFVTDFPEAAVLFWNSSHNLIASNSFDDEGGALAFYGGTANTVWGNWFLPATANASVPGDLFDSGTNETAVNLSENGDLLYNNAFLTPIDGLTPTEDALSCQINCQPAVYADTWNVSRAPASSWTLLNGVNLTGSLVGTSYQGGNYWWNYGTLSDPYNALPYNDTGLITVGGDYVPLTFETLYTVTFRETGLSSGTPWSLTAEGVQFRSNSTRLSLQSPDGTYPYTVAPVAGYTAPSPKSFTVSGANVTISLTFRLDYPVTFTASGLPASSNWSITTSNFLHQLSSGSASGTSPIVLALDNGSYNFTVGAVTGFTPDPAVGQFVVAGNSASETIAFVVNVNATYAVTFTETGLAAGTSWSIGLGTQEWSSTSPNLTVEEVNGTYTFAAVPVSGYNVTPFTLPVLVAGGPTSAPLVTYTAIVVTNPTYPVTFTESGLVSGTPWTVNLSGSGSSSNASSIVIAEPVGQYAFMISVLGNYVPNRIWGNVTVIGPTTVPEVTFTDLGWISVNEVGLPAGTSWSLNLSGAGGITPVYSQVASYLEAREDGVYLFAVSAVGFQADPASGTLSVAGFNISYLNITFAPPVAPTSSSSSQLPEYVVFAVLGVLLVLLLAGMIYYRHRANAPPPPPPAPSNAGAPPAPPAPAGPPLSPPR